MKIEYALSMAVLMLALAATGWAARDELAKQASWQIPSDAEVQARLNAWLDESDAEPTVREQARKLWSVELRQTGNLDLLDRIAATIALAEPRAKKLVEVCWAGATPDASVDNKWLDDKTLPPLIRNNLRLLLGRSLAQGRYFDEALQQINDLGPTDVEDPASLLFYQSVVHHRLVHKDEGLVAIDRLLENKDQIPRRYSVLARLMRSDLSKLKDGSLDDISRRMKDVERHLGLGRSGERVRDIEDEVIEMLDKLIKEEEDRQSQAAPSAASGGQSARPNPGVKPPPLKGPGEVTKRDIGKTAGWGDLPPKEREEAMQEIGRDFPAHYREVIEEYFRELAKQKR